MKLFKPLSVVLLLALGLSTYLYLDLEDKKAQLAALEQAHQRYRILAALLNGATQGIQGTKPEAAAAANRVIDFMLSSNAPPEQRFKTCWDTKLNTTQWGSMGPHGLLDACVSTIADPATATLMKALASLKDQLRAACSSEGGNRYEEALHCWADRSYRLVFSADKLLFDFVTDPDWLEKQEAVVEAN